MAPGVSAGSRRTRGAITVSQPAGQRPGRAGVAVGAGAGAGQSRPERGGGKVGAGAKVIPPPLLAGSPAPSAPLYPLPGASLPRLAVRLPPPPSGAASLRRLSGTVTRCLPPHAPRPPRRGPGSGPPPPRPRRRPPAPGGGRRAPRGAAGRLRRPAGLGSPNSETCYLRAPAERGLPARLPSPQPRPYGRDPPRRLPRSACPPEFPSLARQRAGSSLPAGAAGRAGVRHSGGGSGGHQPSPGGGNGAERGGTAGGGGGTVAAAGAARRGRPGPAGGDRRPRRPLAAFRLLLLFPAESWSPAAPRGRAASPPRVPVGKGGREGGLLPGGGGGRRSFFPSLWLRRYLFV